MEMSLGDLADKFTICIRKRRVLPNSVTSQEIEELTSSIFTIFTGLDEDCKKRFLDDLVALSDINNGIWEMEFMIRQGKDEELGLAVIGSRALKIRDLNKIRVAIKNRINEYSKTGFSEKKVDHNSA